MIKIILKRLIENAVLLTYSVNFEKLTIAKKLMLTSPNKTKRYTHTHTHIDLLQIIITKRRSHNKIHPEKRMTTFVELLID